MEFNFPKGQKSLSLPPSAHTFQLRPKWPSLVVFPRTLAEPGAHTPRDQSAGDHTGSH